MKDATISTDQWVSIVNTYMSGIMSIAGKAGLRHNTHKTITNDAFPFVPMSPKDAVVTLTKVEKYLYKSGLPHPPRFLDAGCGIGNIVLLAKVSGFDAYGIDINPDLIEIAGHLLKYDQNNLDKQDILSYNKYNYFDVVYYYCPLQNSVMEKKFEAKVENDLKVGGIIIAGLKRDRAIDKDPRFKRIKYLGYGGLRVWKKVKK